MATLTPKNFDAEPFVDNSEWSNLRGQSPIDTDGGRTLDDSDLTPVDDHSTNGRGERTDGSSDSTDNPYTDENGSQTNSDSTKDTTSAIDALNEYLNNLGGQITDWKTFYDLMNKIYTLTGADDFVSGSDARLAITEKIADMVYNFTLTLYSNAYQSQMWYEQQEYNSPAQQLKRLADAGLAGMFSSIGSNTAQSAASSSDPTANTSSGAAQIQQQAKQNRIQNALQGVSMAIDLASLGVQAYSTATDIGMKKAQSALIKAQTSNLQQLTPHQVRNAMYEGYLLQGQTRLAVAEESLKLANIPLIEAQKYSTYQGVNYMREQLNQGWTNLDNNWKIAQKGFDVQRELGFGQIAATRYSADVSASASNYAADKSFESSSFGSALMGAGNSYIDVMEEGFQEVGADGRAFGEFMTGANAKVAGLGSAMASTKVGGEVSINGRKYKKVTRYSRKTLGEVILRNKGWIDNVGYNNFTFRDAANAISDYIEVGQKLAPTMANTWKQSVLNSLNKTQSHIPYK